jgi:amino acid transporter
MVIYVLIQIAFMGAHDTSVLTEGWRSLHFSKDMSPLSGVMDQVGLTHFSPLVLLAATLSPLGTALIFIATSSRVSFAMTQNGYFPQALLFLNKKGVPVLAVLANFVVGMLLFLPAPGWQSMVGFLVTSFAICSVIAPVSLVALRSQFPQHQRSFKLPLYVVWCALALFFSNLIIYWTGWDIYSHLGIAMLLGLIVLFVVRHFNPVITAKMPLEWVNGLWVIVYLVAMGALIYWGQSTSSQQIIPEGIDILCIAALSILMLLLSWHRRLPHDIAQKRIEKALKQHGMMSPNGGSPE